MKKISNNSLLTTIMVILLYFLWPYFISILFGLFKIDNSLSMILGIFTNMILLLLIILIYFDDLKRDFGTFKKKFCYYFKRNFPIYVISIILMVVWGLVINIFLPNAVASNEIELIDNFKTLKYLYLINVLFYFPVIEELVFKKSFKELIKSKWLFIIITGLLNAFFNITFTAVDTLSYIWIIPNMMMLCGFSYIYYNSDNIVLAIFFRILYNIIPTLIFLIGI